MTFEGFARQWTPVIQSRRVKRKPVATKIAGEKVVLFRNVEGKISALLDRCPHRGVALSLGKIQPDGCIACPFHGWKFDSSGACTSISFNPLSPEKRSRFNATALAIREIAGLIWIYTGPAEEATEEPAVADCLTDARWNLRIVDDVWNIHWTRAMENMLDSPHVPYLHRRTIGRGYKPEELEQKAMVIRLETLPTGFKTQGDVEGHDYGEAWLEWRRPNGMRLNIPTGEQKLQLNVFCVPIDTEHTRMIIVSARTFGRGNPFMVVMDWFNRYVLYEDQAVVESSDPPEIPPPGEEPSVATDRATLAFRQYYHRTLKPSRISASPETRLLEAPEDPELVV